MAVSGYSIAIPVHTFLSLFLQHLDLNDHIYLHVYCLSLPPKNLKSRTAVALSVSLGLSISS